MHHRRYQGLGTVTGVGIELSPFDKLKLLVKSTVNDAVHGVASSSGPSEAAWNARLALGATLDRLVSEGLIDSFDMSVSCPNERGVLVSRVIPKNARPGDVTSSGELIVAADGCGTGYVINRSQHHYRDQASFPWFFVSVVARGGAIGEETLVSHVATDTTY